MDTTVESNLGSNSCLNTHGEILPGAVISGTMRLCDVLPVMLEELDNLDPEEYERMQAETGAGMHFSRILSKPSDSDYWNCIAPHVIRDMIHDKLNDLAPEGLHWGAHPGDPACQGWWVNDNLYRITASYESPESGAPLAGDMRIVDDKRVVDGKTLDRLDIEPETGDLFKYLYDFDRDTYPPYVLVQQGGEPISYHKADPGRAEYVTLWSVI